MHYLYYINSKYNVCYKMGEGLDKKISASSKMFVA